MITILGDRAANVDITWYHWPCNIGITKNRFYMVARIDKIVISELAATDPSSPEGVIPEYPSRGDFFAGTNLYHQSPIKTYSRYRRPRDISPTGLSPIIVRKLYRE